MSNVDEILKYKELLDNGVISKEEFESKKKELLNITDTKSDENDSEEIKNENITETNNYYQIPVSLFLPIFWLVIAILITIATEGKGFIVLIPAAIYFDLIKRNKYYYNNEKMMVETGLVNKQQNIVPLYRIINITAQDNILNFGNIFIKDKGQTIVLKNVKHSKEEMLKLIEKWEKAKKSNVRNEVI